MTDHVCEWTAMKDQTDSISVFAECEICHRVIDGDEINDRLNWYSEEFEQPPFDPAALGKLLADALAPTMEVLTKHLRDMQRTLNKPK
jgi:hypothetical protein